MTVDRHNPAPPHPADRLVVGVCTRRRPGMLGRLLSSLLRMRLPACCQVSVHVVENDDRPANRALVAGFDASSPFPISYQLETRVGIPQARNCLLEHARTIGAKGLVFVDDDEEVEPDWLLALCAYAAETNWSAVLQGRVVAQVSPACQDYLRPYFQRKIRHTGEQLNTCASNNTLLPLALLEEDAPGFDESRPRDGGTDTIFFSRLASRGVPILYCHEAAVVETIPPERANLRYLSRRKFRVGLLLGSGSVQDKPRTAGRALFYGLKGVASLLQAAACVLVLQRDAMIRAWLRGCRSLGCALGYFRMRHQPYLEVEGF
ncbi:glycosyltransferase family 2 protein [Parahaliea mediterranea]|uniref:Glycosyltransferase n=1 Tax=Parahaliea mediterranea TaxID=651086 RepID=A0A939DFB6_9GAMM|nr:glycosyltransferase family 2 protein [Parahaliea mediterranea]MBN7797019.1 glycosyltransferase [Parahaliea mediterranea]